MPPRSTKASQGVEHARSSIQNNENAETRQDNKRRQQIPASDTVGIDGNNGGAEGIDNDTARSKRQRLVDSDDTASSVVNGANSNGVAAREKGKTSKTELAAPVSFFDHLHEECTVFALQFLRYTDLNNFSECSKEAHSLRSHSTLDQTRQVELKITHLGTLQCLLQTLVRMNHAGRFGEKQTSFKIDSDDLAYLSVVPMRIIKRAVSGRNRIMDPLLHVTSLDLCTPVVRRRSKPIRVSIFKFLALILPNLKSLDMSGAHVTQTAAKAFSKACPKLECFKWDNCTDSAFVTGQDLKESKIIKEVSFQNANFYDGGARGVLDPVFVMYFLRATLERVNVKGARVTTIGAGDERKPLTAKSISVIAMGIPNLRWLKSDLTAKEISQLQPRYPNVVFEN